MSARACASRRPEAFRTRERLLPRAEGAFPARRPAGSEPADVVQRPDVGLAAVVLEVAAGPVGPHAVGVVEEVLGADAVVQAVAVLRGGEARAVDADLGDSVADAAEDLETLGDRHEADQIGRR